MSWTIGSSMGIWASGYYITFGVKKKLINGPIEELERFDQETALSQARKLRKQVARDEARLLQVAKKRKAARMEELKRQRAERKSELRALKQKEQRTINKGVIELIKARKLTITAAYMRSIKDPKIKREIIEATCLSRI